MNKKGLLIALAFLSFFVLLFLRFHSQQKVYAGEEKLEGFLSAVRNLHKEGMLDGQVMVARGNHILLDLSNTPSPANKPQEKPASPIQFLIGSISKQFTAVCILRALFDTSHQPSDIQKAQEVTKKLHLPLMAFLPEQAAIWAGHMPSWAKEVTLHHLLTHTSGIPNYTDFIEDNAEWFKNPHSPGEILDLVSPKALLFSPGSQFSYSNTGYLLLSEVIQSLTNKPYSEYMREILFQPLKMEHTLDPIKGTPNGELQKRNELHNLILPYTYDPRGDQKAIYPALLYWDVSNAKGAGALATTAADLLCWNQALHKHQSVLPSILYTLMTTSVLEHYGYGLVLHPSSIGLFFVHDGEIAPYQSLLCYFKDMDLSIIILSHIGPDIAAVLDEYQALKGSLKQTVQDEGERKKLASKKIEEKYPLTRGYDLIMKAFAKSFLSP